MPERYPFPVFPMLAWLHPTRRAIEALAPCGLGIGIHYRQEQTVDGFRHTSRFTAITQRPDGVHISPILEAPGLDRASAALAGMSCNSDEMVHRITEEALRKLPWDSKDPEVVGLYLPRGAVFCRLRSEVRTRDADPATLPDRVEADMIGFIQNDLSAHHARIETLSRIADIATAAYTVLPAGDSLAPFLRDR